jgi:hypothetical protein
MMFPLSDWQTMSKQDSLRQRLKAADRRRQRRQGFSQPAVATKHEPSAGADVTGMVVEEILDYVDSLDRGARDAMVINAIHSLLRSTTAQGEDAKRLGERLNQIPDRPGVSFRAYRDALQHLLSTAKSHQDPRSSDAFLRYLALLAQ